MTEREPTERGAPRAVFGAAAVVLASTGLFFSLPASDGVDQAVSGASITLLWLLLVVAQLLAARRTGGVDRRAWLGIIAVDVVLMVLFVADSGTETYLPTRDPLPLGFVLGPIAALEGIVVLLLFSRRLLRETNRVAFAADAA